MVEQVVEGLEIIVSCRSFLFQQRVGGLWQCKSLGESLSFSPHNNLIKCVSFWDKPYAVGYFVGAKFGLEVVLVAESGKSKGVWDNGNALIISDNMCFATVYSDMNITNWQLRLIAHHDDLSLRTNGNAQDVEQHKYDEKRFHWLQS